MNIDSLPPAARQEAIDAAYGTAQLMVIFFDHPTIDRPASDAAGYPKYRETLYIRRTPRRADLTSGDSISRPANDRHIAEHPAEYDEYLRTKGVRERPLGLLPHMTVTSLAEHRYFGLRTIEQLMSVGGVEDLEALAVERFPREARQGPEWAEFRREIIGHASNAWPAIQESQEAAKPYANLLRHEPLPEGRDGDLREAGRDADGDAVRGQEHGAEQRPRPDARADAPPQKAGYEGVILMPGVNWSI